MISQYEVPGLLKEELPRLQSKLYPMHGMLDVYRSVHDFTDYTRAAVQEHHIHTVRKCFRLAERLYRQGDTIVKLCIENIFVYAFSSFTADDRLEKLILQSFIPANLKAVYLKQVGAVGC